MPNPFADNAKGRFWALACVPVAVGIHLAGLWLLPPHRPPLEQNPPVEMDIVQLPPPEPEVEEEPEVEVEPEPVKPPPLPRTPPPPTPPPRPPPQAPPPPNQEAAATPKEPPLVDFGVSPDSTVPESDFVAPPGNTAHGPMKGPAKKPEEVKPYKADSYAHYAGAHEVDKQAEVRARFDIDYPEEARKAGVEGTVRLRLWIDEHGKVQRVKALNKVGYGLDEAAQKAIVRYAFAPARKGGKPTATNIVFHFNFYLDD